MSHAHIPARHTWAITAFAALAWPAAAQTSVTTYHNDTLRTGWNQQEASLTAAAVSGGGFGLQKTVPLDAQVDGQPLVVANQAITGKGIHTVVYVATGNDTLYAIDGVTGAILTSRHFGTAVPQSALPGQCHNNGPTVGITSTPVISLANKSLYLMADTFENGKPVFRLHSVNLADLQDNRPPVVVTASHKLSDGSTYQFYPPGSRQRAALLLSSGTVYAAFSSYCDQAQKQTRGWLLGWAANTLAPLARHTLTNAIPATRSNLFLNAIWMSGYGPATLQDTYPIYFITSNSDPRTYSTTDNIDESVLQVAADLSGVQAHYTDPNQANLDNIDEDFGSGGAMLPPTQVGATPKMVFAAGKTGQMVMLDRSAGLRSLGAYDIGPCWCGPSYYTAPDGVGRIVTSGGDSVQTWRLNEPSTGSASLTRLSTAPIQTGQDGGFFTSISSNGTQPGTAVIWAVGRPTTVPGAVLLTAIDPATGRIIYSAAAGQWANGASNANIMPTVANGQVYVATDKQLAIFGLGAPQRPNARALARQDAVAAAVEPGLVLAPGTHAITGDVLQVTDTTLVILRRNGGQLRVTLTAAKAAGNFAGTAVGKAALVIGSLAADGQLVAESVQHAKASRALWPEDR